MLVHTFVVKENEFKNHWRPSEPGETLYPRKQKPFPAAREGVSLFGAGVESHHYVLGFSPTRRQVVEQLVSVSTSMKLFLRQKPKASSAQSNN